MVKCVNLRYTYGDKVPNPWHTVGFGPDGPVDYKDPHHFFHTGSEYISSREYIKIEGKESEFDPEGILPDSTARTPAALRAFVHGTAEQRAADPANRKPPSTKVIPPNPPPRLKDAIQPYHVSPSTPRSETDNPEQDAFAPGNAGDPTDGTDYSLFATSPVADSGTPSGNGLFDGTDLTASLDPSIFNNAGNLFDATNQADLTAFDPSSSSTASNIALSDNNDWTSALLPSSGNSDIFTADNSLFSNSDNLFTADNSGGKTSTGDGLFTDGDISLLNSPVGSTDDNLFAKRYIKTSPRDFRH